MRLPGLFAYRVRLSPEARRLFEENQEVLRVFGRSGVTATEAAAGVRQFMAGFGARLPADREVPTT